MFIIEGFQSKNPDSIDPHEFLSRGANHFFFAVRILATFPVEEDYMI